MTIIDVVVLFFSQTKTLNMLPLSALPKAALDENGWPCNPGEWKTSTSHHHRVSPGLVDFSQVLQDLRILLLVCCGIFFAIWGDDQFSFGSFLEWHCFDLFFFSAGDVCHVGLGEDRRPGGALSKRGEKRGGSVRWMMSGVSCFVFKVVNFHLCLCSNNTYFVLDSPLLDIFELRKPFVLVVPWCAMHLPPCIQVLLLIDASYGFELETFEFINILQVSGPWWVSAYSSSTNASGARTGILQAWISSCWSLSWPITKDQQMTLHFSLWSQMTWNFHLKGSNIFYLGRYSFFWITASVWRFGLLTDREPKGKGDHTCGLNLLGGHWSSHTFGLLQREQAAQKGLLLSMGLWHFPCVNAVPLVRESFFYVENRTSTELCLSRYFWVWRSKRAWSIAFGLTLRTVRILLWEALGARIWTAGSFCRAT